MVPWWVGIFALEVPNISKPKVWLDDFSRLLVRVYPSSMLSPEPTLRSLWRSTSGTSRSYHLSRRTQCWPHSLRLEVSGFFPLCPFKPGRKTNKGVREQWSKFWLFAVYRGLYYPCYIGIIISQCKDHYWPTRISWNVSGGFWSLLSLSDALMRKSWMIHVFVG